jgi:hypothetical protein
MYFPEFWKRLSLQDRDHYFVDSAERRCCDKCREIHPRGRLLFLDGLLYLFPQLCLLFRRHLLHRLPRSFHQLLRCQVVLCHFVIFVAYSTSGSALRDVSLVAPSSQKTPAPYRNGFPRCVQDFASAPLNTTGSILVPQLQQRMPVETTIWVSVREIARSSTTSFSTFTVRSS